MEVTPDNYGIVDFVTTYGGSLVDGMGSINTDSILSLLKLYGLEVDQRNFLKVSIYMSEILRTKQEERDHGQTT